MLDNKLYIGLSQLSYEELNKLFIGKYIPKWKEKFIEEQSKEPIKDRKPYPISFKYLETSKVKDWRIIGYQNAKSTTGFCGAAFKNEVTGQIIFSFRGTEPTIIGKLKLTSPMTWLPEDLINDLQIALIDSPVGIPTQFADAFNFVKNTLCTEIGQQMNDEDVIAYIQLKNKKVKDGDNISFTGHSLGGGLAQYLSYKTGAKAVTFNGVGIGQVLGIQDASKYNVTDYVNADDIVGNYGVQLGKTVYMPGNVYNLSSRNL